MSSESIHTEPRFSVGDTVRVDDRTAVGHCRAPWYLRGKTGIVSEIQGAFRDPERLAYHLSGLPAQVLYKVRFPQSHLWAAYGGPPSDNLEADIYENWLAPS